MFVTILAKKCILARVCYSLAKCCCKIKEDEEVSRRRLFVAASHQTGLDTRSKARRPIK